MPHIYVITMVQKSDGPSVLTSLASIAAMLPPVGVNLSRLVLLNDASDPAFEAELATAAQGDVICAGENLGVAGGRNRLVREARARGGDAVLSVDDDILLPPDFVARMHDAREALVAGGKKVGILTPATLDFGKTAEQLFDSEVHKATELGEQVSTPTTPEMLERLRGRPGLSEEAIYHMGIKDWRGTYLFAGGQADSAIRAAYGVEAPARMGAAASLKKDEAGINAILMSGEPIPVDTAPGGICFYGVDLFEDVGGIDEVFNPFGYEDADFALRASAKGYRHFCVPAAVAIHDIAARLSHRQTSAITATQGKAIGLFASRHVRGAESAAAIAAFTWRTLSHLGAWKPGPRERDADIDLVQSRIDALCAYIGTLVACLPWSGRDDLLSSVKAFAQTAYPDTKGRDIHVSANAVTVRYGDNTVFIATADQHNKTVNVEKLTVSVSRDLTPALVHRVIGGNPFSMVLTGMLGFEDDGRFEFRDIAIRLRDGFLAQLPLIIGSRMAGAAFPVLEVEDARFSIQDDGALQLLTHFFARLGDQTISDFVSQRADKLGDDGAPLIDFLEGGSDRLSGRFRCQIDGCPSAPELSVQLSADPLGVPNSRQRWLNDHNKLPKTRFEETAKSSIAPESARPASKVEAVFQRVSNLLGDDPKTVPFPDAYDPPKGTRLLRKARYIAAGRGHPFSSNEARMLKFRDYGAGRRAFIIGNGPSLNELDLTLLKDEVTFGVNAIYLNKEKMGFLPTHYIVEDVFVAEDRAPEINALHGPTKWIGNYLRYCLEGDDNTCWMNVACDYSNYADFPHFSENAARMLWVGGTVSYICMQLAYFMGFDEVYLIGFDHSYSVPKEAEVDGRAITSTSDDPNHFHPDYFGKGYRWHDPRVDRMEVAYRKARRAYEAGGRKIYNATAGGHLEVFERVNYKSLFKSQVAPVKQVDRHD